jgi:hypothetical protein
VLHAIRARGGAAAAAAGLAVASCASRPMVCLTSTTSSDHTEPLSRFFLVPVLLVIKRLISFAELLPYMGTVPRFTNSLSRCTLFFLWIITH